jgi:putative transcriptional regulator
MRESHVAKAHISMKLSQSKFADLLGVSVRTLQQWEQRRRQPTGAAQTLIKVAIHEPRALRKAVAA